ncbi:hypothetical protein [Rhodopseudomonas sp. B29]|uniref:hypothetical protein n=1 Tax=Rhodopseudomonas sp. B29 TaxID=95607 RepID=UPI0003473DC9|nr:hypothetical protein [Rhodopseudomonas sp. B29]
MLRPVVAVLLAALLPALAHAEEQMLLKPPKGFKVVAEAKTDKEATTAMVPDGQSIANWTDRLTTQTLFKQADLTPAAYRERVEKAAAAECPGASFEKIKDGTENLYPMASWIEKCPKAKDGGKPEVTWWKAVQGRDSFHVVRRTLRLEPDAKLVKTLTSFFDATRLCDTRVPGQRCKLK